MVLRHALKNALIPLITILGPQIPNLITGTIFVEVIFRVPGLGKFFVSSIYLRDYPMIMATMLLVADAVEHHLPAQRYPLHRRRPAHSPALRELP